MSKQSIDRTFCRRCLTALLLGILILASAESRAYNALPHTVKLPLGSNAGQTLDGEARLSAWHRLSKSLATATDLEKVSAVNRFFNDTIQYTDDVSAWGIQDYWATPEQTLVNRKGDCDDFAMAKFLTLLALDVSRDSLRLVVVKTSRLHAAHMVVTYTPSKHGDVLVLDNLDREIRPGWRAEAVHTVYSLDGQNLWMGNSQGGERKIGKATSLAQWRSLLVQVSFEDQHQFQFTQ